MIHNILSAFLPAQLLVLETIRNFISPITDFLQDIVRVQSYIDSIYNYVSDLPYLAQLGTMIFGIVVIFMGLFALVKVLTKIIIVVTIIIALGILYQQGVFR